MTFALDVTGPPVRSAAQDGSARTVPLRKAYSHVAGESFTLSSDEARLLDKRLVFVTGKGGVGKTTVAAALGLAAARRGLRTIVCEVAHQERSRGDARARASGRRGDGAGARPVRRDASTSEHTQEEWLRYQLPSGHARRPARPQPGLPVPDRGGARDQRAGDDREDLGARAARPQAPRAAGTTCVVDAPATGHGLAMLRAPRTFGDIARVGPIRRQARPIHKFIAIPDTTGVLAVALPEEMPVNETLEYEERSRGAGHGARRGRGQRLYPAALQRRGGARLESLDGRGTAEARAAARAALTEHRRARGERSQAAAPARAGGRAAWPRSPSCSRPSSAPSEVEQLSRELERAAVSSERCSRARTSASAPAPAAWARPPRRRRSPSAWRSAG